MTKVSCARRSSRACLKTQSGSLMVTLLDVIHYRHVTQATLTEARDLIQNVLQVDPAKRLTIAEILSHPWFTTSASLGVFPTFPSESVPGSQPASPIHVSAPTGLAAQPISMSSDASDVTYHSASSECVPSTPSTPDEPVVDIFRDDEQAALTRNASDSTLRNATTQLEKHALMSRLREMSPEAELAAEAPEMRPSLSRATTTSRSSISSKGPPALPTRTPARTKRRSVSSTLSDTPGSPTFEKPSSPALVQDFSSLLSTPAPLIFSTALERDLLNNLSGLGFDTGQMVHSVLANACDSAGSMWWMLKRKAERKALQEALSRPSIPTAESGSSSRLEGPRKSDEQEKKSQSLGRNSGRNRSPIPPPLVSAQSAPELQLIPATPIAPKNRPSTPPRATSPSNPLLSPSPPDSAPRSHPSTPGGSLKEKDHSSKGRKARSGSVSIMQRAATALEAAGLVRKKSNEAVKEEKEKQAALEKQRLASEEESRSSHAGSSRGAKSPPLKPIKTEPSTPPHSLDSSIPISAQVGSPWVLANAQHSPPPTPVNSPGGSTGALPTIGENSKLPNNRNRASLLTTFRMWFKEDAKGKRKEPPPALAPQSLAYPSGGTTSPVTGRGRGSVKRRTSGGRPKVTAGRKAANRAKRGSVSSRRSSSVNSKRSSITSAQVGIFESSSYGEQVASMSRPRSDPHRRSFGAHTPNSESRPSSVHSFSMQPRHRKSPSASSAGSMYMGRTSSPLPKFHRRAGSGSSTRVVRQMTPGASYRQSHLRSNSASSNHSLSSSRHGSLYDLSETESRASPTKFKHSLDDIRRPGQASTFVAQKRQTPFSNPTGSAYMHSIGRSSWKKSWGMEPPGWQTRTAKATTIEVLAVGPAAAPTGLRDVFTGRQSLSMGDEEDWVDEDDDGYVGGLGQMPSSSSTTYAQPLDSPVFSPPSRHSGRAPPPSSSKWASGSGGSSSSSSMRGSRSKTGRSPAGRSSPLPNDSTFETPPETRGGRRQLPNRSGPAFRQAIQEEDEDEE